ncbi:MAG TPA: fumarate hydratase [Clostridiales bacterium]|nr:fumarate hydratase [Clostridiales bacterium]
MRIVHTDDIIKLICEMSIEANYKLSNDIEKKIKGSEKQEKSTRGKEVLSILCENLEVASKELIPICQDTGMVVVFMKIGQEVSIQGIGLGEAINEGIRQGYEKGYLRKSIVGDPLIRKNTNDNTPGVIHYDIVEGSKIEIILSAKGFGSENTSRIYMLNPTDGVKEIKRVVLETVKMAGPNPCPPIFVGVGIGGTFEKAAILSKKALMRDFDSIQENKEIDILEQEILEEINKLGIGPGGLGGNTTALGVNIEVYPTHIAGLPVAINICCHANRHIKRIL